MQPEARSEFTRKCPFCGWTAVPVEVTMQTGERVIRFACGACHKTWTATNQEVRKPGNETSR